MVDETERLGIGGNAPPLARSIAATEGDFAAITTAFLKEEYGKHAEIVQGLLDEATTLMRDPATGDLRPIADEDMKAKVVSLIKRMRDEAKALDGLHDKEKTPYLRGGQSCDQFFFGLIDRLTRRAKNNNAGGADVLNRMLTDYDNRKLAEEQERRRREAAEQERLAREAQEREAAARREAEEAEAAAARARNPERREEKATIADEAADRASAAAVEAKVVTARAEEAHIATLAKPADIMRKRTDDGSLSTVEVEKFAEITDRSKLDLVALAPHIPLDGLQKALTSWAKLTDYRQEMAGASIGRRNKSRVR